MKISINLSNFASVLTKTHLNQMKKGLLFVAVIAASLVSCKKDRTCTCSSTVNGVSTGAATVTTYTKATKGAARANCMSYTEVDGSDTYVRTCEVK